MIQGGILQKLHDGFTFNFQYRKENVAGMAWNLNLHRRCLLVHFWIFPFYSKFLFFGELLAVPSFCSYYKQCTCLLPYAPIHPSVSQLLLSLSMS
jgi:hypothetical protein